ncbi:helix-turn-helix domain-containing protein [Filimonas effusa]|uniref:XRE family transcriptional regulator n=1 Tax=Filimonas effusa TaxID=2508721 RepID=A0A4Q1CZI2_9BACT|nr:helix-turn-helix transcriptional regulator [Filimonas effusa]RXK80726.1 XRE family transcriptional regulator [Filimonas effusa]
MDEQQPGLGQKIARLRKAKGLTQEELVEKCHLNVRTLQRIEAGEVTPRSYTIRLILNELGQDIPKTEQQEVEIGADTTPSNVQPGNKTTFRKLSFYVLDLFNLKTNAMKKLTILSSAVLVIFVVVFSACFSTKKAATPDATLVGTWQLFKNGFPDTAYGNVPGQIRYKIITPGHFMVTDIQVKDNTMYAAFFGTLTVDTQKGTYSESLRTAGTGYKHNLREEPYLYKFKINGNFLYTTGINNNYNEVWKRID